MAELVDVTLEATTRAARDLDETEIARAKAQLKVSLLSALETPAGGSSATPARSSPGAG